MMKIGQLLPWILALGVLGGCGGSGSNSDKDYLCTTCVAQPEADPADDGERTGVYKGVVVHVSEARRLSGVLKAVIATDESGGSCEITVDGRTTASDSFALAPTPDGDLNQNGVADPGEDALYSFAADSFQFELSVSAGGEVLSTDLQFEGEWARSVVEKETSTQLVESFEGKWKGTVFSGSVDAEDVEGVFDFLVRDGQVAGTYDSDLWGGSGYYVGSFSGDQVDVFEEDEGDHLAAGQRSNDYVWGQWEMESSSASGTWWGKRKL